MIYRLHEQKPVNNCLDCFVPYNDVIRKRLYFCVSTSSVRDSMLVEKRRSPSNSVPSGTQDENIPPYCVPEGTLIREREYLFYQHIVPNGTDVNVISLFSTEFIAEWRLAMTLPLFLERAGGEVRHCETPKKKCFFQTC